MRCSASSRRSALLEQPDLQILRAINNLAVHGKPPVGDTENQLRTHDPLDVDVVHDLPDIRQHLAGKLQLAEPQGPAPTLAPDPAEIEADHLPERIQPQAPRHDGIVLEVAAEEPEVRLDIEFGTNQALAE